ncbi:MULTISPECIES: ATP-binding protein [Paraburkholderia]|uniref:DUF499 domain-containing protein n=1 Tax=Paraburkholderia madseniana TaxID=2599607 RepID=A0AAP5BL04_9BURK|nr:MULTISPECIES: DUF499 domain-containing protein [Paraburkholderia]MCX4151756.1 DUF499 domain-containing protein [Paraburkholderia madseniana]MDN7154683.1 DUF499 domain-containing protein [Paraburkholderia sp. WS6]MDQ6413566.1 DUF499 domain-containing protein [Paraburkholderia madseniana]
MALKTWREIAIPHEDVLKGTFQQAEFAADISRVHEGSATPEYQNAALFFQRTFVTEGMRLLLDSVVRRLVGKGGDPVIQLQTAFGGGKTHTMLAVYHIAKGDQPASSLQGVSAILDGAEITELPRARVAVLDGINLSPNQPKTRTSGATKVKVNTLWGELAWQLGGVEGYERVRDADDSGTSPGKEVLSELLVTFAPCVVLIDELVAYVRQFEHGRSYSGGTYDSNLSFVQALTEAVKAVPNAVLLASLPESDREAGSQNGVAALAALSHYFGRVQALWKPVATEEAFEIVRRRLFENISDRLGAENVCRSYADMYAGNSGEFPAETRESHYFDRMKHAYPVHPEVFDRLYEDWSSLDNFQRTRGVLKLMATVIHRLWQDGNNDLLIQPASLPLYASEVRNEAINYLVQGWDPVLEKDIDGERATTTSLDSQKPLLGSIQACRRVARTIFLGSAPDAGSVGGSKQQRGLELERIYLGVAQPGQVLGYYGDAVRAVEDRLQYLNGANNRFWFDTRPNLRREMEDRKRHFDERGDVYPLIRERLRFAPGVFAGVHIFTSSNDVPDDWSLRLVVLPPDAAFSRSIPGGATDRATTFLQTRGDQPRIKQNRLIFLAAEADSVGRLKDHVRSVLAWQSIVNDVKESRLNLDQLQAKQASRELDTANDALARMVKESYKWLLAPVQHASRAEGITDLVWEHFPVNPAAANRMQEIEQILRDNELLITQWAPIHLRGQLQTWFWKDSEPTANALDYWHKSCAYLYLPRLKDADVLRATLEAGATTTDFFGFAYGREEGRYVGFQFGKSVAPILDETLLLIEPTAANAYADQLVNEEKARQKAVAPAEEPDPNPGALESDGAGNTAASPASVAAAAQKTTANPGSGAPRAVKRSFFGAIDLDPIRAEMQFVDVVHEVINVLLASPNVRLKVSIEIEAEAEDGFEENLQRAIKENCAALKFKQHGFEE